MTQAEFVGAAPHSVDVTWGSCALDAITIKESPSSFVLSQATRLSIKPDFDKSHKLFGLNQKAPTWAFFSPPNEISASSQRCFKNGQIISSGHLTLDKLIDDLKISRRLQNKEFILKCLMQMQELNKISEDLYRNIYKFQKG